MGYRRKNGKVGTRNYIGIVTTVNCSGSVAKFIADAVEKDEFLEGFENIDGVVPIVHGTGCGMSGSGEGYDTLFRTLTGYVQHPNFGATLLIELGCEVMTLSGLVGDQKISVDGALRYMTIQNTGGTRKAVERGVEMIRKLAKIADGTKRTTILSEISEIYGAEHLLTRRAVTPEIGEKLCSA